MGNVVELVETPFRGGNDLTRLNVMLTVLCCWGKALCDDFLD